MSDRKGPAPQYKLIFTTGEENVSLNNHLKEYRAKINVNQQELGAMVHVSRQTISLIERGDYSPSVTLALKLAGVFDVKVEDIFEYTDDGKEDGNEG